MALTQLLQELISTPPEELIQPDLKQHRLEKDEQIREDQDLADGAVMQASLERGEGNTHPGKGDLVFVHVSIRLAAEADDVLHSTRAEEGGTGQPLVFMLQKGHRAPRAWEIALTSMYKGGRSMVKARPAYGYRHPACKLAPPPGVPPDEELAFDLQLLDWRQAKQVRACGANEDTYKWLLREGTTFELARPPFEVNVHITLRQLAYDAVPGTGLVLFSTELDGPNHASPGQPLTATMGSGQLPPALEEALGQMCKGERAAFVLPASSMQPTPGGAAASLIPAPPSAALQLEAEVELLSVVQVRDMTGTGEVMKRRLVEGRGEFPIDCPLSDTTVRVHYRVRGVWGGTPGPWLLDTRSAGGAAGDAAPVEIDTGCADAPEAIDMSAKLMLPGELALISSTSPKYAYAGRQDAPPGLEGADEIQWELELVSFDKEGHWQVMEMEARFALAERVKAKANALVKAGRHAFAAARYERLLRLMESTRDYETDEEIRRMDGLKLAVLLNLALCATALGDHAKAIVWCDKALQYDDKSAKAVFRRGHARSLKGDYEEAAADLQLAAELDAGWQGDVERELAANKRRAKEADAKQKREFKNFFGK